MKRREKGFMSGIALLTLSAACAKLCGMLFKLPLVSIIGDGGMGYFNSAYVIYTFFFVLSTSGLPVGLSILIAESTDAADRFGYLKSGLAIFGGVGGLLSLIMMLAPKELAHLIGNPGAEASIRVMAPSLLAVCLSGCLRGYFQGQKDMMPTAVSQVVEAAFKTVLGILLAYYGVKRGENARTVAAMALLGVSVGSILSFFYLVWVFCRSVKKYGFTFSGAFGRHFRIGKYAGRLLSVVLPVSGASVVLSVSSVIDLSAIMNGLLRAGFSAELANELYGNYSGSAVPLFNLPSVLVTPVASAVIPFLAKDQRKQPGEREAISGVSLRLAAMISAPCAVGLAFLAHPVLTLLFGEKTAATARPLLQILAPAVFLVALQTVSGAVLQGRGKRKLPVASLAIGAAAKLVICYLLVPRIGIAGAPIGTFVCYLLSTCINLFFCIRKRMLVFKPLPDLIFPLICAFLCGATAHGVFRVLPEGGIYTLTSIGAGAAVYCAALVLFGAFDSRMMQFLPFMKSVSFQKGKNRRIAALGSRQR